MSRCALLFRPLKDRSKFDGFVKSPQIGFSVIPVKPVLAKLVPAKAGSRERESSKGGSRTAPTPRLRRNDDFLCDHQVSSFRFIPLPIR
jgi:hypothetical protein